MSGTNYFTMLDRPMCTADAARSIYTHPTTDEVALFNRVNGFSGKEHVGPGHFVVVPSLGGMSEQSAASLSRLPQQVNHQARHTSTAGSAKTLNDDFHLLKMVTSHADKIDGFSGGIETYLNQRTQGIATDLKRLDSIYRTALRQGQPLNSAAVIAQRKTVEQALKAQLTGISKGAILKNAQAGSIKDALGISHKSVVAKQFKTSGNPYQVKEIADAIRGTGKMVKIAERVGMIGKVVTVMSLASDTHTAYQTGGAQAAAHTMGKTAAGMAGGIVVGEAAAAAGASAAMLVFGVGTGGVGFVVIGIAAVSAGFLGGKAGTYLGEEGYVAVEAGLQRSINWIVKASE